VTNKGNSIASADAWRSASQAARLERAEILRLPSGATILASRPEPLEWILAGRLPQRLLGVALENHPASEPRANGGISREEILELARFATQIIRAAVVEPRIGEEPGEIALEEIPMQDRVFIFEWACRAFGKEPQHPSPAEGGDGTRAGTSPDRNLSNEEGQSILENGIERFRQK
jgi:hypothetical protein